MNTNRPTIYTENITQHVSLESIPLLAITWNVNGHVETNLQSLREQLLFPKASSNPFSNRSFTNNDEPDMILDPQMVIIGLQELIELSTTNVIGNAVSGQETSDKLNQWDEVIIACLKDINDEFELLESTSMVGLGLLVYVWRGLKRLIQNVQIAELPRGVGGVLGNKGAIYVRFEIFDTSICLINSHFAAHRDKLKKRNQDYYAILHYPAFPDLSIMKAQQIGQNQIDSIKSAQAKGLINNVKKKLQNYYTTYGNAASSLTTQQLEGNDSTNSGTNVGSNTNSLPNHSAGNSSHTSLSAANNNPNTNSQRYSSSNKSRVSSYSSNKSAPSSSYIVLEDSDESDVESSSQTGTNGNSRASSTRVRSIPNTQHAPDALQQLGFSVPYYTPDDHDIILWMGDLNYRIVSSVDISTVYEMIQQNDLMTLLTYDQLNQEKEKNNIFQGFHEGLLTFPPTYQYIPGKDLYDNRKESKKRCPAWCDRILWRIGKHHTQKMIMQELEHRQQHRISRIQSTQQKSQLAIKRTTGQYPITEINTTQATNSALGSTTSTSESNLTSPTPVTPSNHNDATAASNNSNPLKSAYKLVMRTFGAKNTNAEESSSISSSNASSTVTSEDEDEDDEENPRDSELGREAFIKKRRKRHVKDEAIMTLNNTSLDDMLHSKSNDSASGTVIPDMKPEKTNVSQLIIQEEEEEEDEIEGLVPVEEEADKDGDDDDDSDEGGDDEDGQGKKNRQRRLSMREINQIKTIAEQLLKKAAHSSSRGSVTSIARNPSQSRGSISTSPHSTKLRINSMDPDFMSNIQRSQLSPVPHPTTITPPRMHSYDARGITPPNSTRESISKALEEIEQQKLTPQNEEEVIDENKEVAKSLSNDDEDESDTEHGGGGVGRQGNVLREKIELISYDRCPHNLSDHKAVRALINLKVKRVNWKENERSLVQSYSPYLRDVPNSYHPANNTFHHLYQLLHHRPSSAAVTTNTPTFLSSPNRQRTASTDLTDSNSSSSPSFLFTSQRWIVFNPTTITLRSISKAGDSQTIDLSNLSDHHYAKVSFVKHTIPDWLLVSNANRSSLDDVIAPNSKIPYNFENDHMKATLALVESVEEYKHYSVEKMPRLGKYLNLPCNNMKMEISAIVTILVQWFAHPPSNHSKTGHRNSSDQLVSSASGVSHSHSHNNTKNPIVFEEHVHIPVLCTMSI